MDLQKARILDPPESLSIAATAARWVARVREELPGWLEAHPSLSGIWPRGSLLLYGSTARGLDDAHSDIDLLLLVPEADLRVVKSASHTVFFDFLLQGKSGHLTVEPLNLWRERLRTCRIPYIYHLCNAVPVCGEAPEVDDLLQSARQRLPNHVAHAYAAYHYTEMRGWHRSCDNAMERHDAVALLLLLPQVVADAMRAALVMQGVPYPYDKWLYQELACRHECAPLCESLTRVLDLLAQDGLRSNLQESVNPISGELRVIRRFLVEAAESRGWDEPWLEKWWLYMHEIKDTLEHTTWNGR